MYNITGPAAIGALGCIIVVIGVFFASWLILILGFAVAILFCGITCYRTYCNVKALSQTYSVQEAEATIEPLIPTHFELLGEIISACYTLSIRKNNVTWHMLAAPRKRADIKFTASSLEELISSAYEHASKNKWL